MATETIQEGLESSKKQAGDMNTAVMGLLSGGSEEATPQVLTSEQQQQYYATQSSALRPLSPLDWLSQQNQPAGTTTPTPEAMAEEARQRSLDIFNNVPDEIPERDTGQQIIQQALERIASAQAPEAPNMQEMFQAERERLGMEPLEAELNRIDAEIDRIQTEALVESDRAEDRAVGMAAIGARQSTVQRAAQRELAFLQVERQATARIMDSKLRGLEMAMNFTQQDFQNASTVYNNEFNRAVSMINLMHGMEDREISAAERVKNNATAQLETVFNLMTKSGKSFEDLTEDQRREFTKWETEAGYPVGMFESLQQQSSDEVLHMGARTDGSGRTFFDILRQSPDGQMYVEAVYRGQSPVTGSSATTYRIGDDTASAIQGAQHIAQTALAENPDMTSEALRLLLRDRFGNDVQISDVNAIVKEAKSGTLSTPELVEVADILAAQEIETMFQMGSIGSALWQSIDWRQSRYVGELDLAIEEAKQNILGNIDGVMALDDAFPGRQFLITQDLANRMVDALDSIPRTNEEAKEIFRLSR